MTYTQTSAQPSTDVRVTGRRVVATLVDGLVFGVLSFILTWLFGTETTASTTTTSTGTSSFSYTSLSTGGSLVLFLAVIGYYVLMEGLLGRTVGKMVTGIRVVREDGTTPPGIGAAVLRTLCRIVDGLFGYLVGFIIVLAGDRRRRLGDMAAKTQVVRA